MIRQRTLPGCRECHTARFAGSIVKGLPNASGSSKLGFAAMPPTVPVTDEIREILVRRIDHQKRAVGVVVGVIEPNGRRVVAYGNLANGDPRTLDGDTIFE